MPIKFSVIGRSEFDWHILTGSCAFLEELRKKIGY